MNPDCIFIVYGSLAPGRENHSVLAPIKGEWRRGTIRGRLETAGWGSALGYPGYVASEGPEVIDVHLLFSEELPMQWSRLDTFEGADYERVVIDFITEDGQKGRGNIYALKRSFDSN